MICYFKLFNVSFFKNTNTTFNEMTSWYLTFLEIHLFTTIEHLNKKCDKNMNEKKTVHPFGPCSPLQSPFAASYPKQEDNKHSLQKRATQLPLWNVYFVKVISHKLCYLRCCKYTYSRFIFCSQFFFSGKGLIYPADTSPPEFSSLDRK